MRPVLFMHQGVVLLPPAEVVTPELPCVEVQGAEGGQVRWASACQCLRLSRGGEIYCSDTENTREGDGEGF